MLFLTFSKYNLKCILCNYIVQTSLKLALEESLSTLKILEFTKLVKTKLNSSFTWYVNSILKRFIYEAAKGSRNI